MNKIIYLDAAASSLKPDCVIAAQTDFLQHRYANAGRGVCARAGAVDDMVTAVRERVANFIGATPGQIVFTNGATDGLNRAANIIMAARAGDGTVVAVSDLDHHSARLPWMARTDVQIVTCPLDGHFNIDAARVPRCDVIVVTAMSNVFGVPQDVAAIVRAARHQNPDVIAIVDAAQFVAHMPIDANTWGADFICFSGHKIGADTGVGVMYVKNPDSFLPDKFGGAMVQRVQDDKIVYSTGPHRFEAGTLPLTQIVGLGAAIDYMAAHSVDLNLIKYMYDELSNVDRIKIVTARDAALLTFYIDGMHVLDFGALVGARGLCLRVGNMCASWAVAALGQNSGVARLSVGPYNTADDVHGAVQIIKEFVK